MKMEKKPVTYCVVDTFTDSPFKENPTAVCLLDEEREDDEWFQTVASEFNLPMTCFLNSIADSESETHDPSHSSINPRFRLRWFNPVAQVKFSLSGASVIDLKITTTEEDLILNVNAFWEVVLPSGKAVIDLQPQFDEIRGCPGKAVIITGSAPLGFGFDFFSSVFDPKMGINEYYKELSLELMAAPSYVAATLQDLVTGSAHCALSRLLVKKLGKCDFVAYQASARGGILNLHLDEKTQRVLL
ncbi:unnamed protein product [Camellia sinensis]